ncbi:hypothetical protein ACIPYQ_40515 [Streptomyces sp. NPDC090045]|uniref:hypothetical protein n=1 Tax=Streptomyces sp. NPDC090045 TaxID=3365927 RepID=UPI0037F424D2
MNSELVLVEEQSAAATIPDVGTLRTVWAGLTCVPVPRLERLPEAVGAAADTVHVYLGTVGAGASAGGAGPLTAEQARAQARALQSALRAVTAAQALTDSYRAG